MHEREGIQIPDIPDGFYEELWAQVNQASRPFRFFYPSLSIETLTVRLCRVGSLPKEDTGELQPLDTTDLMSMSEEEIDAYWDQQEQLITTIERNHNE